MANVVLYNPAALKIKSEKSMPPLGLMALSSCLKKNGFTVEIIDGVLEKNPQKKIINSLDDTICVGITCLTGPQIADALSIAKIVKENKPEIPIVWGGFHPTLLPEETIRHELVDMLVRGQGEETIVELVNALKNKLPLNNIQGLTYKEKGKIISNPSRPLTDINKFPMLDYFGVNIEKYIINFPLINSRILPYSSSRSCPHRCGFCAISKFYNRIYLPYPAERVVKEIEFFVKKFNINGILFQDDNFFVNKKRVEDICDLIIEKKLDIKWGALSRCNYFARYDKSFLDKLIESGCTYINFGVESGSSRILKLIKKDITIKDVLETAKKCKKMKVNTLFNFILGFPTETTEDFNKTIELIDKIKKIYPDAMFEIFSFIPLPSTELFDKAIKFGLKSPSSLEEWARFSFFQSTKHLVWCNKKQKELINTLVYLINFLFSAQNREELVAQKKLWKRIAYKILSQDAKFRWKRKFFAYGYEWKIIEKLSKSILKI